MRKYFVIAALLSVSFGSFAQTGVNAALSAGGALLFKATKSKLTNDEKNWFFKQLNLTLSKDKKHFTSDGNKVDVQPYITDMNKDGVEEVFIVLQSVALFGDAGESFMLYIKNSSNKFERQDELGGGMAMILLSKNPGYPDIAVGGPGFEFPSYHWDGKKYKSYKKIKDADLQSNKIKYMTIADYSKLFTDAAK